MLFKKNRKEWIGISSSPTTLISEGTEVVGDVTFVGNLEIMGSVVGNITSEQENARVRVLNGASVQGDILSSLVEVNGLIKGDIYARDHLCLESQCEVDGTVYYKLMEMKPGAQVVGSCVYQESQINKSQRSSHQAIAEVVNVEDIRNNKQLLDKK